MKLFSITERELDLGFGDAPPKWCRTVRAKDIKTVQAIVDRVLGPYVLISIREIKGIRLADLEAFLHTKKPEPDVIPRTDVSVEDDDRGRWWDQ